MKKYYILLAAICLVFELTSAKAQKTIIDSSIIFLDKSDITTGILFQSEMDTILQLDQVSGDTTISRSFGQWSNLNYFIAAGNVAGKQIPDNIKLRSINDSLIFSYYQNQQYVIPIFIQNINYNIIKKDAIDNGLLEIIDDKFYDNPYRVQSPYFEKKAVSTGFFLQNIPNMQATFLITPETYITNTDETLLFVEIDPDNGNGYQSLSFNQPITIQYSEEGIKSLVVKITTMGGVYTTGFELKVQATCDYIYMPDFAPWSSWDNSANPSWKISTTYNGEVISGNAYLKYSDSDNPAHVLDKPFILVEGIDFNKDFHSNYCNGDLGFCGIFSGGNNAVTNPNTGLYDEDYDQYFFLKKYPILIENLKNEGYDIILLDFFDGALDVEKNTMLLVKLIEIVKAHKYGNEPIVVSGASMGGQIARLALAYMEKENIPHCSRLYISMDSPHKDSNIPAGLQQMMKFLAEDALSNFSGPAQTSIENTLNRPASMQLGSYNITPGANLYRNAYVNWRSQLGYPQFLRRIGIANGARNAVGQEFDDSELLFKFNLSPTLCLNYNFIDLNVWATPGFSNYNIIFSGKIPKRIGPLICIYLGPLCNSCANIQSGAYAQKQVAVPSLMGSIDRAPGGKRRTIFDVEKDFTEAWEDGPLGSITNPTIEAYYKNHCFIPTISALDINTDDLFYTFDPVTLPLLPGMTPFDAVYAPIDNEQHSESTDKNIEFVMSEVLGGEIDIVSPLTSSSPNNGIYNIGNERKSVLQGITIGDGGKLYINANLPDGEGDGDYPAQNSTLEVQTCFCENVIVKISNNGQMILGETSPNNKATVKFKSGSTLKIGTGGKLIINDYSKLIIEPGATIIIEQGAQIELNGSNAVLEIQGTTEIDDNAIFTFTGTGFIRYCVPSQSTPSIIAGVNSQIYFSGQVLGSGIYQKVLEIKGSTLWPEDDLKLFRIEKGEINFLNVNPFNYPCLNLGCPYQFYRCNFTGNGYLQVWGTGNSLINLCTFDGAYISGDLYIYNNILKIKNTTIKNLSQGTGLSTIGQGVELTNVTFDNCGIGWNSLSLLKPSIVSSCTFSNSGYGILVDNSAKLSSVLVKNSTITSNYYGIYTNGPLTLGIKCGNINNNSYGVEMDNNGALSMSSYDNTGGVDLSNNGLYQYEGYNIYLDRARQLYLDQGFNKLYYYSQHLEPDWMVIKGTINYSSCDIYNPPIPILANNNQWYSYSSVDPPSTTKYDLRTYNIDCPSLFNYSFYTENDTDPFPSCNEIPNHIPADSDPPNPLKLCNSCIIINTTDFQNVLYNVAIDSTIALMDFEDSTENDLPVIDKFYQILMSPLDSANANMLWLAELAFSKMNAALANAFKTGRITEADNVSSLHPYVQKVIDVYNRFAKTSNQNNFTEQFYLQYSKAQVYALAGKRDITLNILDSIKIINCYIGQDELQILKRTRNLINAEHLIITGVVPREKFDSLYTPYIPPKRSITEISSTASVSSTAQLGEMITIGSNSAIQQNVILGDSVTIGNNVTIKQNTVIGNGTIIGNGATIEKDVVIGENSVIGENVKIKKECKIGNYDTIANNTELEEKTKIGSYAIIGQNSKLKKECLVAEGSMLGVNNLFDKNAKIGSNVIIGNNSDIKKEVNIGDGSIIRNNVKINQNVKVGSNTTISDNLTLGSNSKICDGLLLTNNIGSNSQLGTCVTPSSPATAMQVQYNCEFAIARAKKVGYFFNGFKAVNVDTSKHIFYTNNQIKFISKSLSTTYFWDFGDCSTSTEETSVHEYSKPGIYVITLTINNFCNSVQYIGSVTIAPGEINPSFDIIASANCVSDNILKLDKNNFIVDLTSADCYTNSQQCKSYSSIDSSLLRIKLNWDFGTIRQPLEEIFTIKQLANNSDSLIKCHINQAGEYPIELEVTLQRKVNKTNTWVNTEVSNIFYDTINYKNISADFEYNTVSCYTDTVKFFNKTTGGMDPISYQWNFGNGDTSSLPAPSIRYTTAGIYNVQLVITDKTNCADTVVKTITIKNVIKIYGYLYSSLDCGGAPVVGDTLIFKENKNILSVITPVITAKDGSFCFDSLQLCALDSTKFYAIATKSGMAIETEEYKTLTEWAQVNPNSLQLANVGYKWTANYSRDKDTLQGIGQIVDAQGNIYVLGNMYIDTTGNWVSILIKYNPEGQQQWVTSFSSSSADIKSAALAIDISENVIVAGTSNAYSSNNVLALKYDSAGSLLWAEAFPLSAEGACSAIVTDSTGNCYLLASDIINNITQNVLVLKYSSSGNLDWVDQVNTGSIAELSPVGIELGKDGNIIIGCNSSTDVASLLSYSSDGQLVWVKNYNVSPAFTMSDLKTDNAGNIYFSGISAEPVQASFITAYKIDAYGIEKWEFDTTANNSNVTNVKIETDSAQNVYIVGLSNTTGISSDITAIKIDTAGNFAWETQQSETITSGETAKLSDMTADVYGNVYLSYNIYSGSTALTEYSSRILKIGYNGNIEWQTSTENEITNIAVIPAEQNISLSGMDFSKIFTNPSDPFSYYYSYDLKTEKIIQCPSNVSNLKLNNNTQEQNNQVLQKDNIIVIPNPNNGTMRVLYNLINQTPAVFEIYDLSGRKVFSQQLNPENNSTSISQQQLYDGVYMYRVIQNDNTIAFDKIVIIK